MLVEWEESQGDLVRTRTLYERALRNFFLYGQLWLKYPLLISLPLSYPTHPTIAASYSDIYKITIYISLSLSLLSRPPLPSSCLFSSFSSFSSLFFCLVIPSLCRITSKVSRRPPSSTFSSAHFAMSLTMPRIGTPSPSSFTY